jgi:hypothetical protein
MEIRPVFIQIGSRMYSFFVQYGTFFFQYTISEKEGQQCFRRAHFAVNKDTTLQVLRRRQKVLCEFRHCLVCGRPCQKKTNSGWEIVGDKHTAVPSSGGGWERYPSCADQTLTAGEVKKQVNARAQKVYKMKIKVDKLIQKKNNKETQ